MLDYAALYAITDSIIGGAIRVHKRYGPGLLESVYPLCLAQVLIKAGHQVEIGKPIPLEWEDFKTDCAFRVDLLVDDQVVVEVKSVEKLASIHRAQMLTYLKLTRCPVGLLINFNVEVLRDGIRRVVNDSRKDEGQRT